MRRFRSIEDVIWKAYIRALTPWFGVRSNCGQPMLGRTTSMFVCPPTQQGIAAGPWVPREVTNNQIHSIADQLLPFDSPVFMPEGSSYFRALRSYMAYVKLGGMVSPEAQVRLTKAQDDYIHAQNEYEEHRSVALANITEDLENKHPFDHWAVKKAPDYIAARKLMRCAEKHLLRVQQEINGNIASIYSEDYKNLSLAIARTPEPGFNMPCITEDTNTIDADLSAATIGTRLPIPKILEGTFYRPNYSLENYQALVKDWVLGFKTLSPIELQLDLKAASSASWSQYGFDPTAAEENIKSYPLLTAADSEGGGVPAGEEIDFNRPGCKVDIKISYRGLKLLNISPGMWDIPDVRRRYPNLSEGAPTDLIPSLVKAEKLLVGYGPGLEITFDTSTFNSTTSALQEAQDAGGKVSLFGFDITAPAQGGALAVPFESVQTDVRMSRIRIPAVSDTFPVLVGVLARKL